MAIQNRVFGDANNTFTGGEDDYIINAGNGNNTITLGGGNDQLTLGSGNNSLTLGGGTDAVFATGGNNTLTTSGPGRVNVSFTDGNNTVTLGDGPDVVTIGNGLNNVTVGNGDAVIQLGNGVDQVTSGDGSSRITVGNGVGDTIVVGYGPNVIAIGTGAGDVVHTQAGGNTVSVAAAALVGDTIMGALGTANGAGNKIVLTTAGAADAVGVSGFASYQLAAGTPSSLALKSTNFARLGGAGITVLASDAGSSLDATLIGPSNFVRLQGGHGFDSAQMGYAKARAGLMLNADGSLSVAHDNVFDTFVNAEQVAFGDGGTLNTAGDMAGFASLSSFKPYAQVSGAIGNEVVNLAVPGSTLAAHGLVGTSTLQGFVQGDAIDLLGVTGVSLATVAGVSTATVGGASMTLGSAPAGTAFALHGDAKGGTMIVLDGSPASTDIAFTDVTTSTSGRDTSLAYSGPVDFLQRQYISGGSDAMALRAETPNAFLKGGSGDDALHVTGGNNVLDGSGGSNFLVGGSGADGGVDTFFVDGRGGVPTWSTIVGFHAGDSATMFGFTAGTSTLPFTASDGAAGFSGLTLHSELGGAGTGVNASMTFAGIDQATADAHFSMSTGTLQPGTAGATDYLLIQYNR